MKEFSILIGGKAGFGIDTSGSIIADLIRNLGYHVYIYRDYPSLIRGGHTFSIIRVSSEKVASHRNKIDFLLAMDQDTFDFHKDKLKEGSVLVYDQDSVKINEVPASVKALSVSIGKIIKEENGLELMRNTCLIGAFCKSCGLPLEDLNEALKDVKDHDLNFKIAKRGYDWVSQTSRIDPVGKKVLPILSGNEALCLGLVKAGLDAYVGYPMTPSSGILHYLAYMAEHFGLTVLHPESETAVILMALGFSYAGKKAAVGTSGGGFCLMTEGLSFSGMAELPVVLIVGQRTGPSTGLPTYTGQSELNFVINAGHGEFPRMVVAPADAEEAYFWSGVSLNLAWKYQIPAIILTDKTLAEGGYSFDVSVAGDLKEEAFVSWDNKGIYKRYQLAPSGVSPLAFVPESGQAIKINGYEHDESGITTEEPLTTKAMQEKRQRKANALSEELEKYNQVNTCGNIESKKALVCWGSNKGVCAEVADKLRLKVICPTVLWPFPVRQFIKAVENCDELIFVENNIQGQLKNLSSNYGIKSEKSILKYDGRPFTLEELEEKVAELIK